MSVGSLSRADSTHRMIGLGGKMEEEEEEEEGWAAVKHAVSPCSACCMSALGLVRDGRLRRSKKAFNWTPSVTMSL